MVFLNAPCANPDDNRGDRPDPRGGIRWIIPEKADYWSGRGE
jgi:hypothetical protein